ncbi:MAG: aminotransferase class I/II-fold pyridoxal phosphate-dependent enzyme [Candidatus Obscuribacterales bacterium]|nr:aminotransferase class I/II-fold pyridoxal phosphate-dependent enzyme [Candidatus Obscuribacterales bacterium]
MGESTSDIADLIFQSADSHQTTKLLHELLRSLDESSSNKAALASLHKLALLLEKEEHEPGEFAKRRNLFIKTLRVPGIDEPIKVLLNSAVFSPEFWGRTFAEGILKSSESFSSKTVVELGTGSGWISLLLLKRTAAIKVLGLDINPIAVLLANLNKWLNGTKSDGSVILSPAGIPIAQAFHAEVSDLLGFPLAQAMRFDRIIGCIPQVLHPVPEKAEQGDDLSYEDLYDLSNYCFNQGILEDRFGLPLIARALEEAQLCLNPNGQLLFILGGRPGQQAIEEVFRRRGYKPNLAWVRRIQQADDTDLIQLVQLEKAYGIKFHFFSSPTSRQSIPAATAVGLQQLGRKIFHDLLVYQAETQFEKPTLAFVRNLHKLRLDSLRKELDFSRASDEQMSFLERLSSELLIQKRIPYPHEKGDHSFREKLARFLALYCHYPVHPEDLFVGAERQQLLAMILKMVSRPSDKVLLSSSLEELYGRVLSQQGLEIIQGNNDLDELLELDAVFQPRISVFSPQQLNQLSPLVLDTLIEHAHAHPERWYLVDDSENFDIGSQLQSNLLMRLLAHKQAPPNLIFLYGLIKNTVCPDFELSFLINAPKEWVDGLEYCAELSYSRISYIIQLYYEWLFDELLSFPFAESGALQLNPKDISGLSLSEPFKKIAADPVFDPKPISLESAGLIRLDYGEFEEDVPDLLLKGLVKGFLENSSEDLSSIVQHRVAAYLKYTRKIEVDPRSIVLGQGSFPLFGTLLQVLRDRLGRAPVVALANGTYGPIFPMAKYYGAEIDLIETDESNGFAVTVKHLASLSRKPDLLLLAQPANPSGLFLSARDLEALANYCAEHGIFVCSDEIFFLLSDVWDAETVAHSENDSNIKTSVSPPISDSDSHFSRTTHGVAPTDGSVDNARMGATNGVAPADGNVDNARMGATPCIAHDSDLRLPLGSIPVAPASCRPLSSESDTGLILRQEEGAQTCTWTPPDLSFAYYLRADDIRKQVFVADGLAKAFAAGGLRCGFMLCPDRSWADDMRAYLSPIPQAILRAWDRLYSVFLDSSPHQLIDIESERREVEQYLLQVRSRLRKNRESLLLILQKYKLDDGLPDAKRGALFLLAKMGKLSAELARQEKVLTNPGAWGRTGDWVRFCFCVDQDKLEQALLRIEKFLNEQNSRSLKRSKA